MSRQPTRDTQMEVMIRKELFRKGFRYRKQYRVPGAVRRTIDIAFPGKKLAIFIDGCFWHGCPTHGVQPRNNAAWWRNKLDRNIIRDRETDALLSASGWRVLRVWEHESVPEAVARIAIMIGDQSNGGCLT